MKKRITDLLNGKIEYEPEAFEVSTAKIEGTVMEGTGFRGKFSIKAREGKSVQGFLYSTNVRAGFSPSVFYSSRETFTYEIDTRGMKPGSVVEGSFYLCTTSGEFQIPYFIRIEEKKEESVHIPYMTPEEFSELARQDFSRAYVLFVSREFPALLEKWGTAYTACYHGFRGRTVSYHSLEQFLTASGLKEPLRFELETDHVYLHDVEETTREELVLIKKNWGFCEIGISCEGDFLAVERTHMTTEEFVGSMYHICYMVHREKLHSGRNFARITVKAGCETYSCIIEVRRAETLISGKQLHQQKLEILRMMSAYIDYSAERMGQQEWAGLSLNSVENYRKAGGTHIFFELYEIYLRFQLKDQLEAELMMQEMTSRKKELVLPQWQGFYLYLNTFYNGEKECLEYVQEEIRKLYLENQENWVLQWLMFRVNAHLIKNDTEKLDLIRRQYLCGCKSPILYLEAYQILKKEPLMLRSLEKFEVHLLRFICREHLLDREICGQTAQLACRCQRFEPVLFGVLCRCFEVYPSKKLLTAICTMLIKGHKNSREYRKWFELGVHQDVRITGLYEYYVETMEELNDKLLPQAVRMYFIYHNTLDYVKKAAIYANIIRNRSRDQETWENYRSAMELFMEEQLLAGRINRDLALLYEVLLNRMVLDVPMAKGLEKVLFTYEICCENPEMRHVLVIHEQLGQEQRVQLTKGRAYVRIYSPYCSILMEDGEGRRYGDPGLYQIERLLRRPEFEAYCREVLEVPEGLLIYDCCSQSEDVKITEENAGSFRKMMRIEAIRPSFKKTIQKKLVEYYYVHSNAEGLEEFLKTADQHWMLEEHKKEYTELLTEAGLCREAYEVVCRYGGENVSFAVIVKICSHEVRRREYEEDRLLTALCIQCFMGGVYEEDMMKYLILYYEGPVECMKRLWRAARGFELEAFVLEERILTIILFMQKGMENTEDLFEDYWRHQGRSKLCRAYATLMSYRYFVKEEPVKDNVFAYMEQMMLGTVQVADVCRLAMLRYYGGLANLTQGQKKWRDYLLAKYLGEGMRFAFYGTFPERLRREYLLEDKFVVEYRANPADDVVLHYRLNDEKEQSFLMQNTFEGIFTKEFVLFYGDRLTWYFTVEKNGKKTDTPEQTYTHSRRSARGSYTRYDLLNRMEEAQQKQNEKMYQEVLEQYIGQRHLVEELF